MTVLGGHGARRSRRRQRARRLSTFAVLLGLATWLLSGTVALAVSSSDVAATHAYLAAVYRLEAAFVANAPLSRSAARAAADQLGRECPGVLAGSPAQASLETNGPQQTPRVRGEERRRDRQWSMIESEIYGAVFAAVYAPDRSAEQAFAQSLTPLTWSDPRIARLVHERAERPFAAFAIQPPAVCADVRAWSRSGYRALSTATRELERREEARLEAAIFGASLTSLLKPNEGPAERALIKRTTALQSKLGDTFQSLSSTLSRLQRRLGVKESPLERHLREPPLGSGKTRAGGSFTVRRGGDEGSALIHCRLEVSVEFSHGTDSSGVIFSSGSSSTICLSSRGAARAARVGCDEGDVTITANVPGARSVRLLLSNGRTVVSRTVIVPAGRGAPAALYVQALPHSGPRPVALTELDARGETLRTFRLPRTPRCSRPVNPEGPTFVPLVHGVTPDGRAFAVEGVLVRFAGAKTAFSLSLRARSPGQGRGELEATITRPGHPVFEVQTATECPPHQHAILYGLLKAPGTTALARTASGMVPLQVVPIPAHLHAGGSLAYGAFTTLPSEVVVKAADGRTLFSESLVKKAKEDTEFCEGYAEG